MHSAAFGTIMEAEEQETSPVRDACLQLTEGLLALSARDNMTPVAANVITPASSAVTASPSQSMPVYAGASVVPQQAASVTGVFPSQPAYNMAAIAPAQPMSVAMGSPYAVQQHQPLNPVLLNHSGWHCKSA